ncbi:arylsulfatase [Rhizorhabdus histidinilytica]|uniref:arylsulfatase n=1 Tax=Rhizorhabdus histidinilytica TaxID=439228 RepID=UPI0032205D77
MRFKARLLTSCFTNLVDATRAGRAITTGLILFANGAVMASPAVLPVPTTASATPVGRVAADMASSWPKPVEAPANAPNVILILTDDVGFGAASSYGGPIPTPNFDALGQRGLRYTQYNNAAICSATRAALLTGRNEHAVGMGTVTNAPTGYEGYTSSIPKSAGTVAEILRQNGYQTAAIGKWHLVPEWEESQAGPFDHWPTQMGFQYYYGFIGADTDQFTPALTEGTSPVEPPHDDPTYILDRDLADHAIRWIGQQRQLAPDKPFFLYYATGSTHAPHQAPPEWLAKFRGKFDRGWDVARSETFERQKQLGIIPATAKLTKRPDFIPAWSSLSPEKRRVFARLMEAYAAQLAYADYEIGRVIDSLRASGQLDNTMIVFVQGDNGASGEGAQQGSLYEQAFINRYDEPFNDLVDNIDKIGGPDAYNNYPTGWGWAMNAPFQYYKQTASHFGGLRDGMIISWPSRIKDMGGVRPQFHYVTDIAPTIFDAAGVQAPAILNGVQQMPIDGISMAYSFDQPDAPSRRRTQVFEMMQNLGIYHDGWWAGTTPTNAPWDFFKVVGTSDPNDRKWELYNVAQDYSQADDKAKSNPKKLLEMQQLFWAEAARNKLLPIHSASEGAKGAPSPRGDRTSFSFQPGLSRVPPRVAPETIGHSYTISADIEIGADDAQGVLVTHGGKFGGYAFYLDQGVPVFHYNAIGTRQYQVRAAQRLSPGHHVLTARFEADESRPGSGGMLTMTADGQAIASGRIEHTLFARVSLYEGFDVGQDTLSPVNADYRIATSRFRGKLNRLDFTIDK